MSEKRKTTDETNEQSAIKKVKHEFEPSTCLTDLPNEIILLICHYLSPIDVLESFLDCNKRLFCCISEYHQKIDLTKCSCREFYYYMALFQTKRIHPSTLIINNVQFIKQIKIFFERILPSISYDLDSIHHLSLLECSIDELFSINSNLSKFKSLKTLQIIQSMSNGDRLPINYSILEHLTHLIFYNPFNRLNRFELIIDDGLILSKQLLPNRNLKYLTISLQNINDLYVLLDGLMPNLIVLTVTLCQSDDDQQLLLPNSWPCQSMFYLEEFKLITKEIVEFSFNELCNIVIPLIQLKKLSLYIRQWINNEDDQRYVEGNQLQLLFEQFLPKLDQFCCSIRITDDVDIQIFSKLSERWPMKCHFESENSRKHIYTIPWSFKHLDLSMLADDDTNAVCPNVRYLILDIAFTPTNVSYRFPNIHTLTILPWCQLSHDNYIGFRQLRYLTMKDINVVPLSIIRRIHTMSLFNVNELSTHSIIYSNIKYFTLNNNLNNSLETVETLIQHFPNLRSLQIQLERPRDDDYYDSLNILLDGKHLPHLLLLKTNCVNNQTDNSKANLWIQSMTSLKWRSIIFCAYRHQNNLTICL